MARLRQAPVLHHPEGFHVLERRQIQGAARKENVTAEDHAPAVGDVIGPRDPQGPLDYEADLGVGQGHVVPEGIDSGDDVAVVASISDEGPGHELLRAKRGRLESMSGVRVNQGSL